MRLYEIQWIGPPRAGGAEIIDRVADSAPDDDAIPRLIEEAKKGLTGRPNGIRLGA